MSLFTIDYHIKRSVLIDASREEVFRNVADFHQWSAWSPWSIMERGAEMKISKDGKEVGSVQSWRGKVIGEGKNTLVAEKEHEELHYHLQFVKPFKSEAKTSFVFDDVDSAEGGTKVTWHMKGHLPFFLFFMREQFEALIINDFDRGLKMLKAYAEKGSVASEVQDHGIATIPALHYVGIERACTKEVLSSAMQKDWKKLMDEVRAQGLTLTHAPLTMYKEFNMKTGDMAYIVAAPVMEDVMAQYRDHADFVVGTVAETKAYKTRHVGDYAYLDNAWTAVFMYLKAKKCTQNKRYNPLEFYMDDVQKTPVTQLRTDIYVPIK